MSQLKHVIKIGSITSLSGTGSFSLPALTKDAMSGANCAWILVNTTALGGGTSPGITTDVYTQFSDVYLKTATALVSATGVTKINGDETVAPVALGTDILITFSVSGSPSAVGADVYLTLYKH